jgi:hypothetical protein
MVNKYIFTAKELVALIKKSPIEGKYTDVDKELEMERHLSYIGKEPVWEAK